MSTKTDPLHPSFFFPSWVHAHQNGRNRLTIYLAENDVHFDLISVVIENLSKFKYGRLWYKDSNKLEKLNEITLCFGNVKSGYNLGEL